MPVKWNLFGLANYILLLVYLFLADMSFRFIIEQVPGEESLVSLMPILFSQAVIIINSVFNIFIFHIHLPNKPLTRRKSILYKISSILYAITFSVISIYYFITLYDALSSHPFDKPANLALAMFFAHLLIGIFILVCQFNVRKFLEKQVP